MNALIDLYLRRFAAQKKGTGYRAQALKLFPWVCGRGARTFDHANLHLLEVHLESSNHHDNPPATFNPFADLKAMLAEKSSLKAVQTRQGHKAPRLEFSIR